MDLLALALKNRSLWLWCSMIHDARCALCLCLYQKNGLCLVAALVASPAPPGDFAAFGLIFVVSAVARCRVSVLLLGVDCALLMSLLNI